MPTHLGEESAIDLRMHVAGALFDAAIVALEVLPYPVLAPDRHHSAGHISDGEESVVDLRL